MTALRLVLGDQLSRGLAGLADLAPGDVVLMAEVAEETTYVPHHKQKIALVLSAMRHFAAELAAEGIAVDYVRLDDPGNTGSLLGEVALAADRHGARRIILTEPGEWRLMSAFRAFAESHPTPVEIREDERFLCSHRRFRRWAAGRREWRMEWFYREMRRETGFLMEQGKPVGGQWNFDRDNRKRLPARLRPPPRTRFAPDAVTAEVIALVARRFPDNFGELDGFGWAVTRADALEALAHFLADGLPGFGDYQDAMKAGEPFLFHAVLSPYINIGLLDPREVCAAAEREYRAGRAPLNAVEGFVRQILGWREYVRGLYWLKMPDYAATNALAADRPLPWFYWTGETDMACLGHAIGDVRRTGYGHHIQRLMVTGLFALLAGVRPAALEEWFLAVYVDAFEWVELPNVHGMALYADGGVLASKPYAASGAYIDRMSDYCAGCRYDRSVKSGPDACPFDVLYWDFLARNEQRLAGNPRMAMPYRTLRAMPEERRTAIASDAARLLDGLERSVQGHRGRSGEDPAL